jgi:hypothetical protein
MCGRCRFLVGTFVVIAKRIRKYLPITSAVEPPCSLNSGTDESTTWYEDETQRMRPGNIHSISQNQIAQVIHALQHTFYDPTVDQFHSHATQQKTAYECYVLAGIALFSTHSRVKHPDLLCAEHYVLQMSIHRQTSHSSGCSMANELENGNAYATAIL